MDIEVTHKVIGRMVARSNRKFAQSSFFSYEVKELVRELRVFIIFNPRLKTCAGQANAVTYTEAKKMDIDMRYKRYLVDCARKYLIIEINKDLAQSDPPEEVYDTVSHEFAHCVDFVIRGFHYINGKRRKRGFHDPFWKQLHIAMGGSGSATILK
jgi:hypothetical protein